MGAASPPESLTVEGVQLRLREGDITTVAADAIVNAANESLLGGGGVDGAIHRAGGPSILEECQKLGGCAPGDAKITGAGRLPARYVIHAVGPRYYADPAGAPAVLASVYRTALALAEAHNCASIAFPSISTGAFGYPVDAAAEVALATTIAYLLSLGRRGRTLQEISWVLFDRQTFRAYAAALVAQRAML